MGVSLQERTAACDAEGIGGATKVRTAKPSAGREATIESSRTPVSVRGLGVADAGTGTTGSNARDNVVNIARTVVSQISSAVE